MKRGVELFSLARARTALGICSRTTKNDDLPELNEIPLGYPVMERDRSKEFISCTFLDGSVLT